MPALHSSSISKTCKINNIATHLTEAPATATHQLHIVAQVTTDWHPAVKAGAAAAKEAARKRMGARVLAFMKLKYLQIVSAAKVHWKKKY